MQSQETACVLAAIILADENQEPTAANLKSICDAAGVKVDGIWFTLFANYLEGKNVKELLTTLGSASAAPAPAAAGAVAAAAEAAPAPAKKEESDDDEIVGAGGMFGGDSSSSEEESSD